MLLVEQKSAGRDLVAARDQAGTYFDALPERDRPRYQLLCDFQTFELLDRDECEETRFALVDLPRHVEKFWIHHRRAAPGVPRPGPGQHRGVRADRTPARCPQGVRTVFCLFADDTGIFEPRDIFLQFIEERTGSPQAGVGCLMFPPSGALSVAA